MVSITNRRGRHKKSRKGCIQCKSRHVKCDEKRPTCTSCGRLGLECEEQIVGPALWTSTDMRLLHHCINCSCLGFSVGTSQHKCWTQHVSVASFGSEYLLHQILAVATLHSHLQNPDDKDLSDVAAHHRSLALKGVQPAMTRNDPDSSVSLFAFAGLTAIYCFGEMAIKQTEHAGLDIIAELMSCFHISRGITTVLRARQTEIQDTWAKDMVSFSAEVELARLRTAGLRIEQMQRLSTLVESRLAADGSFDAYIQAAVCCEEHISLLLLGKVDEAELSHLVMTWPHEIQEDFVHRLEQREPIATVILAYYAVLMTMSPKFWWLKAWPRLLLDQIESVLPSNLQHYLTWPRQMIESLGYEIELTR